MTTRHSILAVTLALLTALLAVTLRGQAPYENLDLVDAKGNIRKPQDYRDRYQMLGVYTVLDPKGNEMHYTYASPGTAEYLPQERKVRGWNRTGERSLRNRSRATDDRGRTLGCGNESLVRDDQGRQGTLSQQSALGRRMGMGALQIRRARQAGRNGLQERLPGLSHSREGNRLGLRARLSGSQHRSNQNVSRELIRKQLRRRLLMQKYLAYRDHRWTRTDRLRAVSSGHARRRQLPPRPNSRRAVFDARWQSEAANGLSQVGFRGCSP